MVHTAPMTVEEFQERLRQAGEYATDATRGKALFDRLFGKSDAWYYSKMLRITVFGRRAVGNGTFTDGIWAECSWRALHNVEACGGLVRVDGAVPVAQVKGPVVYVSNHMSGLETYLLPCILLSFSPLSVVVKEALVRYPLLGPIIAAKSPVCVGRENPREDFRVVMEEGCARLAAGRSVLLFPQATRSVAFKTAEFNSLGAKLAARAAVPLVPLALKTNFQGIGRRIRDFGPVDRTQPVFISFGPPLPITGNGRAQHEQSARFIAGKLKSWSIPVEESAGEPPSPTAA
jgi:1-acyl-sn-glycerol-3-phosphate acyltransferase